MKSFRLYLTPTDQRLIIRLSRGTLLLARLTKSRKLYRLTMWMLEKAPPWGTLISATVLIEYMMMDLMSRVVVREDGSA